MTPEELIKLCDEAEKHNTGSVGRQKRIKAGIAALETAGFSSSARARSYAALQEALDEARVVMRHYVDHVRSHGHADSDAEAMEILLGAGAEGDSNPAVRAAINEALATTEEES